MSAIAAACFSLRSLYSTTQQMAGKHIILRKGRLMAVGGEQLDDCRHHLIAQVYDVATVFLNGMLHLQVLIVGLLDERIQLF